MSGYYTLTADIKLKLFLIFSNNADELLQVLTRLTKINTQLNLTEVYLLDPCKNGGTCVDKVNAFECVCKKGFEGDACEFDIDECSSNPCLNGASCRDYVDGYVCSCLVSLEKFSIIKIF